MNKINKVPKELNEYYDNIAKKFNNLNNDEKRKVRLTNNDKKRILNTGTNLQPYVVNDEMYAGNENILNGLFNFINDRFPSNLSKQKYLEVVDKRIFYIQNPEQEKIDKEQEKLNNENEKKETARLIEIYNNTLKQQQEKKNLESLLYDRSFNKKFLIGITIGSIIVIIMLIIFSIDWNLTGFWIFLLLSLFAMSINIPALLNWIKDERRIKELQQKYK